VVLYHVNHREKMRYAPYDANGKIRKAELARFNRFMRDGNGKKARVGKMHPRLASLFYIVALHYASQGKQVEVISGYRPDAKNPRSPHRRGLAVDFRVRGVPNRELMEYLRTRFQRVGVGYYPNSVFVHFDVRQKSAFWIDYSGPGEDPIYSEDPLGDLKSGRAETYKPSKREKPAGDAEGRAGAGEDAPPPGLESDAPDEDTEPAPPAEDPAEKGTQEKKLKEKQKTKQKKEKKEPEENEKKEEKGAGNPEARAKDNGGIGTTAG